MQAIEFESIVQDHAIRLPALGMLSSGQPVRVVVMFDPTPTENEAQKAAQQAAADTMSREPTHPARVVSMDRLSTLVPHLDAISELCEHPLVLPDFLPLSRDAAHER